MHIKLLENNTLPPAGKLVYPAWKVSYPNNPGMSRGEGGRKNLFEFIEELIKRKAKDYSEFYEWSEWSE
jgi:hypothetical protein